MTIWTVAFYDEREVSVKELSVTAETALEALWLVGRLVAEEDIREVQGERVVRVECQRGLPR